MRFHAPPLPGSPEVTRQPADAARAVVATTPGLSDLAFARPALVSPTIVRGSARIAEFALLSVFGFAIAFLYVPTPDLWASSQYLIALTATALLTVVFFEALGLYTVSALSSIVQPMSRLLLGWTMATGLLVAAVFFLKIGAEFSRVWLALWFGLGAVFLISMRAVFSVAVRHWVATGQLSRRAVVYGDGPSTGELLSALAKDPRTDISVFGVFDDRAATRDDASEQDKPTGGARAAGYPQLGTLDDLVAFARRARIDVIILNLPVTAETRMLEALSRLSVLPADIRIPAAASRVRFQPRTYSYIGDVPFIDVFDRPITDWGLVAKWAFDKVVAATAIALLAPVFAAIALAVRLESKGPILFRQKRYGFNNELIEVCKFRSMYVDRCDHAASKLVTRDDPRVTKVGRFIRRTSLDELPQLFNVLRGELSLVGPRPHALQAKAADKLYNEVVDGYFARHKVKPGITGWAQINGWRGETDTPEKIRKRVEHDIYYIENWSLFLDLYILIRTPFALLNTENAY